MQWVGTPFVFGRKVVLRHPPLQKEGPSNSQFVCKLQKYYKIFFFITHPPTHPPNKKSGAEDRLPKNKVSLFLSIFPFPNSPLLLCQQISVLTKAKYDEHSDGMFPVIEACKLKFLLSIACQTIFVVFAWPCHPNSPKVRSLHYI